MNATLSYIFEKFGLTGAEKSPIEIPNFGRNDLAVLFRELEFRSGAEIGVERGEYSEVLAKANPDAHLFLVDPWTAYGGYRDHVNQEKLDGFHESTRKRMAPYDCELVPRFSMDAVKWFNGRSLDFVYIDANHEFRHVVDDIVEWSKKVRPGGIVSGHDYKRSKRPDSRNHVVAAVKGYTFAYRINPWFVLGSQAKDDGLVRDDARSWMWVKA